MLINDCFIAHRTLSGYTIEPYGFVMDNPTTSSGSGQL